MRENRCEKCKHFDQRNLRPYGICMSTSEPYKVHELDTCADFKRKSYKVKPRRLCDFCERGKRMESEEGEHDLRLVKLTPLPAINLTSGETSEKAEPPFYAMFLYDMDREDEAATFQVKFCPFCGRKLVGE